MKASKGSGTNRAVLRDMPDVAPIAQGDSQGGTIAAFRVRGRAGWVVDPDQAEVVAAETNRPGVTVASGILKPGTE